MLKLNKKKIILIALITIYILGIFSTTCFAVNPDRYKFTQKLDDGVFLQRAGKILGYIQYIGIVISVLALAIIGIKYMLCSLEEKAEFKKSMIPYVVGIVMLMGVSIIIGVIGNIAGHSRV